MAKKLVSQQKNFTIPLLLPFLNTNRFTVICRQQKRFIFQTLPTSRRLYDILEIPIDANKKIVKSQFYKLSKKYHPDLNLKDNTAHKKFLLINEAYSILINDKSRKEYDRSILFNEKNNNNKSFSQPWKHSQFSSSNRPNVRRHTHHNFGESNFRRGTSHTDNTHKHYQRHYSEELRRANSESNKEKNQFLENQLKSSHGRTVLRIVLIVSTLLLFGGNGGIMI